MERTAAFRELSGYFGSKTSGKPFFGLPITTTLVLLLSASFSVASMPFHTLQHGGQLHVAKQHRFDDYAAHRQLCGQLVLNLLLHELARVGI